MSIKIGITNAIQKEGDRCNCIIFKGDNLSLQEGTTSTVEKVVNIDDKIFKVVTRNSTYIVAITNYTKGAANILFYKDELTEGKITVSRLLIINGQCSVSSLIELDAKAIRKEDDVFIAKGNNGSYIMRKM